MKFSYSRVMHGSSYFSSDSSWLARTATWNLVLLYTKLSDGHKLPLPVYCRLPSSLCLIGHGRLRERGWPSEGTLQVVAKCISY